MPIRTSLVIAYPNFLTRSTKTRIQNAAYLKQCDSQLNCDPIDMPDSAYDPETHHLELT